MIYRALPILAFGIMSLAASAKQKEMIALAGSGVDKIAIIEKATGTQVWSYTLPHGTECNTIAVKKNGDVVFSYKQGVKMVDPKGVTIWDYPTGQDAECQTARLLPNGNVLAGICANPARFIELNGKTGKVISEVNYDLGVDKPHGQFRQICKSASGNYLVPVIWAGKVVEINPQGVKVGEWKVPNTPFSVKELASGDLLVSTFGSVVEVNRKSGEIIRTVASGVIGNSADTLRFGTEAQPLKNGNTMISNWQGYLTRGEKQLVELDKNGKIVYTFRDTDVMRNVSGFYLFKK
ncbi:MAG: PQQ-binding-like beta-propeller repeat protein [Mucinivorans sp.]